MNARVETTIEVLAASAASTATRTGRLLAVGTASTGPQNTPTLVRGMAEFRSLFGGRTGAEALYDCLQQAFATGLAEAVVVRGTGAAAVKADADLDTATVTAIYAGAAANSWTAAITLPAGGKPTFTLTGPGFTETYSAADKPGLIAAVNSGSSRVRITGTIGTADSEQLAGGTGNEAGVDYTQLLGLLGADWGAGVSVIVPGKHHADVGEALAQHAKEFNRLALITLPVGTAFPAAQTAAAEVAAEGSGRAVVLWPSLQTVDGVVNWAGAAAGLRARAHALVGPQQSLIAAAFGTLQFGSPEFTVSDADWRALDNAGVSVLRTIGGATRVAGWKLTDPIGGNTNLDGAQHADIVNAVQAACQQVADSFIGATTDARGVSLQVFASQLKAVCAGFAAAGALTGLVDDAGNELDPGYVVDTGPGVNAPADVAAGRIAARVSVRLPATAEFIRLTVSVGDLATVSL